MRDCPNERTLERLFVGEGHAREFAHLRECPECALRMRRIERDLERIREALFADPPRELVGRGVRGRTPRPLRSALVLSAAAACVGALLWIAKPVPVLDQATERPASAGALPTVSEALFPDLVEDSAVGENQRTVQLAALGTALRGERPCTLEDQWDTDTCDGQDVTTLAELW
ncbi:MAG TPA: hypothetical protein VKE73_08385 [Myxococcota bacterium]|nr:hypothetical protein [Myxococcota bacterium]